ncbi:MAG: pantetheine-phosphate adenylyltransferase [Acidobacteriota bacterium]
MKIKAVFPGSFDPITNGHVDIVMRGIEIFDEILIAILENPEKTSLFSIEERISMIKEIFREESKIKVESFSGLLVEFMKKKEIKIVIRGLRAVSDFEYELQMALMNRKLDPEVETFFMVPNVKYSFLSSRLIKEIFYYGGCVNELVPEIVEEKMKEKYKVSKEKFIDIQREY